MGKFDTHGGYFAPQGYLRVDTGGSHEENPNGGVQLGVDQQGVPNMLEEGEPVYDDYVYSDNIEADEDILKSHGIPVKYAGKLYSKIADSFVDEAEERPNDPISNNGLNAMLVRLADAQEEQKMIKQRQELEEDLANMSPEELTELEALLGQEEQAPVEEVDPNAVENVPISEEAPVEQVVQPEQEMIQPMPGMAFGGYLKSFKLGGNTNDSYPLGYLNMTYPMINYHINPMFKPELKRWDAGIPEFTIPDLRLGDVAVSDTLDNPSAAYYNLNIKDALKGTKFELPVNSSHSTNPTTIGLNNNVQQVKADATTAHPISSDINLGDNVVVDRGIKPLATFSRYAGPLMAGIAGIYNAFQKPDHYEISQSQSPIYARGRMDLLNPSFNPLDQNQAVNDVLASGAGTIRALSNSGLGPSAPAAIIAADNNIGRNVGNARATTWDANNQRRNQVLSMINNNAATKAQFDYGVDRTNAAWANEARNRSIMNDLYIQRLNNQAESEKFAAIQRQWDALSEAISNIGRENVTLNQINSNTALPWNVGHNGWAYYAPSGIRTMLLDDEGNPYYWNPKTKELQKG